MSQLTYGQFPYSHFLKKLFFSLAAGNSVGAEGGNETINLSSVFFFLFFFFSLGCGIGYGYLHRIPTKPFGEGKKISFPGNSASDPISPLKDGFTEVRKKHTHTHIHAVN